MSNLRTASARRTCLVVLGMHRSGTSAITRIVGLLGAALPRTVLPPAPDNLTGFWETPSFIALNDGVIARLDSNWDDWRQLPLHELDAGHVSQFADELRGAIAREYGAAPMFVVKDPRVCRLAALYVDALARCDIAAHFLLIVRNPLAVMASLAARDGMTERYVGLLWLRHLLDAELQTRAQPRTFLRYESLLSDWQVDLNRAARQLGICWPRSTMEAAPEVTAFLQKQLQHHAPTQDELNARDDVPPWVKAAYATAAALEGNPTDAAALQRLDDVRSSFDASSRCFGDATFPEFRLRQSRLHKQLADNAAAIDGVRASLATSAAATASLQTRLEELGREKHDLSAGLEAGARRIAALASATQALTARLAVAESVIAARDEELSDARAGIRSLSRAHELIDNERRALHLAKLARPLPGALRAQLTRRLQRLRGGALARASWSDVVCLERSGLFEEAWYLRTYQDVMVQAADPLLHYLVHGANEGRNPHPLFDTRWYLDHYADVRISATNPLVHYIRYGAEEGRDPGPYFSTKWYCSMYADVVAAGLNPLRHYWRFGAAEGRQPTPSGDALPSCAPPHPLTMPLSDSAASAASAARPVDTIDCRIVKKPPVLAARQNVIFVTHLPEDVIKPHTIAYLKALRSAGLAVVVIAAVNDIDGDIVGLDCDVDGLVVRSNHGYDFSAWAHVLRLWPELWDSALLVFANDSVFGPLRPELLQKIVATLRTTAADFVGLTDSCERDRWHIQSYFFALKPRALASAACREFWHGVHSFATKQTVIDLYELGWAEALKDGGLSGQVLFPSRKDIIRERKNPTLVAWKHLLAEGFPFIKIQLLRDRIPGTDRSGWERIVSETGYDIAQIYGHLQALQKKGAHPRPIAGKLGKASPAAAGRRGTDAPIRVNFVGPWNFASGLGVASRGYLSALWHTKLAANLYPVRVPFHTHGRVAPTIVVRDFEGPADICIVHLNPDAWPALLTREMRDAFDSARYKVGLWVWEMEQVPAAWREAFAAVDFVWAPSTYCGEAFRSFSPQPVRVLPHVVSPPAPLPRYSVRAKLGIPPRRRLILYTFDGASYLIRKNPFALVRAFAGSGLPEDGWSLVLNTKNLLDRPGEGERLAKLAEETREVHLINRSLSARDQSCLLAESEIYASPHSSEGFGLTIAEAMAAGKLVVATDYGGSTDFLDAGSGFPVKCTRVALQHDFGHYTRGSVWACVDEEDLERALRRAATAADDPGCEIGKLAAKRINERLSPTAIGRRLEALCLDIAG